MKKLLLWLEFAAALLLILLAACQAETEGTATSTSGGEGVAAATTTLSPALTPIILPDNATPSRIPDATATQTLHPSITPSATPTTTPSPTPVFVNDVATDEFIILPPEVIAHSQEIFANGQVWGRNSHYFSKMGDSTVLNPQLLGLFDDPTRYNLGAYSYLQPTLEFFAGAFDSYGVASQHGLHSWSVFDPLWAPKKWCETGEHMLACEFRLNNPSILIIRLGSNDAGSPSGFDYNVRQVVEFAIENGVIPLLATKADRFEGDNSNNEIIRQIATDYQVPLWDFDRVAETLPERGLDTDMVHMKTVENHDYTLPETFTIGHSVQDLTGLMVLDALRQLVIEG